MEITVKLDETVVEELDDEAGLQGFDDRDAYLRWIIAHRPMSKLASKEAPALASRVSELEERMKVVERQIDLDTPVDPDTDLGDNSTGSSSGSLAPDSGSEASLDADLDAETEPVDLAEPEDDADDEAEAADDDIAEAIDDVSLEDGEEER